MNMVKKLSAKVIPKSDGSTSFTRKNKLVIIHSVLTIAHLTQSLTQFGLAAGRAPVLLPVTRTYLSTSSAGPPWSPLATFMVDSSLTPVQVMYMTASFLLITSVAHFFTALGYKYDKIWTFDDPPETLKDKRIKSSTLRWLEYSITSTIMIVAILLISAVSDVYAIIAASLCNFAMILFGHFSDEFRFLALEGHACKTNAYFAWAVGAVVGLGPWIAIWMSFAFSGVSSTSVGAIVASATFTTMSFFFSFAAVSAYYTYKSPKGYKSVPGSAPPDSWEEYIYPGLSATSKSLLSWLVYGALLQATV